MSEVPRYLGALLRGHVLREAVLTHAKAQPVSQLLRHLRSRVEALGIGVQVFDSWRCFLVLGGWSSEFGVRDLEYGGRVKDLDYGF